jgi:hypothetical protein
VILPSEVKSFIGEYNITVSVANNITFAKQKYHSALAEYHSIQFNLRTAPSANEKHRKSGAFFVGGRDLTRATGYPAREGEKSTAAGGGKREIFRVATTWLLPTELRRVRERKSLSCNSATERLRS